jgi:hypothetical protein
LAAPRAERLDEQILNGGGSAPKTMGLLNQSSIDNVAYTGTPTVAGLVSNLGNSYANVAVNYGVPADMLILHSRRLAWLKSQTNGGEKPASAAVQRLPPDHPGARDARPRSARIRMPG